VINHKMIFTRRVTNTLNKIIEVIGIYMLVLVRSILISPGRFPNQGIILGRNIKPIPARINMEPIKMSSFPISILVLNELVIRTGLYKIRQSFL